MVNRECRTRRHWLCGLQEALAANLNAAPGAFPRAAAPSWTSDPDEVWDVLHDGARRARTIAEATMVEVRAAIGLAEKRE